MTDRVESIKAYHERRNFGTAENRRNAARKVCADYRSLTAEECRVLAEYGVENLVENILSHLACFQPGSLAGRHVELAEIGLLYPPVIYHGADHEATSLLIRQLDNGTAENVNLALLALAWADNELVVDAFARWRSSPPDWIESLHVPPHEYADSAGWEFTNDQKRRALMLEECLPLVPPDHPDANPGIVTVNSPSNSNCGWCGRRMTALFDIDLTNDGMRFLGIDGTRLRIETCDVCTCYGNIFSKVDWQGGCTWHSANEKPDYLPDDTEGWGHPKEDALCLSRKKRSCMESADRNIPISYSQIGGHPSWEQDAEYPHCPSCKEKMLVIAQLSKEDFDEYAEGIQYAFLCRECQAAATHYQQT